MVDEKKSVNPIIAQMEFTKKQNPKLIEHKDRLDKVAGKEWSIHPELGTDNFKQDRLVNGFLDNMLNKSKVWNNARELFNGELGRCHTNCAKKWHEGRSKYKIVTGFALSLIFRDYPKEDIYEWVRHSWLYDTSTDHIIETTDIFKNIT